MDPKPDGPDPGTALSPTDPKDGWLPALGDEVAYIGKTFVVRDVNVNSKSYTNPSGPERVLLTYRMTAWAGEAPYEEPPATSSMF